MDRDDDLARMLPQPPPPHPARRAAAIAVAMRRFDGIEEPLPRNPPERAKVRPAWWPLRGAQIGALASILLVALISIPIALHTPDGSPSAPAVEGPAAFQPAQPGLTPGPSTEPAACGANGCRHDAKPGTPASGSAPPAALAEKAPAGSAPADAAASRVEGVVAKSEPLPAPQPQMAAAAPAAPAPGDNAIVVTASRAPARNFESATSVTVVAEESLPDRDVVVTGTRSPRSRAASRRGDWNACTVNDPAQSLRGCRHLIDPGATGPRGAAAAILADGLMLAWRDDMAGAIGAFDRAIMLQPRLAVAYLNRGIAHQREGDLHRAAADLDLAIRYSPHAARGYYYRGIVRRQLGNVRGARADAARAVQLDPRYDDVVE